MGDLPRVRFSMDSPFHITGTDYAGPFFIKNHNGRNPKISKCYICLFVCFSTKAIHLELVSELSSAGFIQALRRFVSRRGQPSKIYSDNGSNYVGANRELKAPCDFIASNSKNIEHTFSKESIE